jgi:hypothetical protein
MSLKSSLKSGLVTGLGGFLCLVAACSSSKSSNGGTSSSSSGGDILLPDGAVVRVEGGASTSSGVVPKVFTPKSSFFFKHDDGTIDLLLSDQDNACNDAKAAKLGANETLVQLYSLGANGGTAAAAVGAVAARNQDTKYATVGPSCPSGQPANNFISKGGEAISVDIQINTIDDATVTGHATVEFDSGLKLDADFSSPVCTSTEPENLTCR